MKKSIFYVLGTITISLFATFIFLGKPSSALSGSDWNAGKIIDDSVFYNGGSMSVAQIQAFLDSKVPVCDTNGVEAYGSTTRAAYGTSRGYPPPYVCLKNYQQTIPALDSSSDYCNGAISAGTKSAATIIRDVGVACNVSPKVLLVLLQKEQSLVTDVWPWDSQYKIATGYGCPDTAPCDAAYYGFFNQVFQAANAFNRYAQNSSWYNYRSGRNNSIYYNPDLTGCGSSNVFIENSATAALYVYTPYQPNQAALNNLYGAGDSCSAYGNRNFWRMYNDWFGSTVGAPPSEAYIKDGVYSLIGKSSGKAMDINGGSTSNGSAVQLYTSNNSNAQKWQFTRDANGYYDIKNAASGISLDVTGGVGYPGTPIQVWAYNGSCAQKWSVFRQGTAIYLLSKCSGYALDVAGGQTYNGARVQLWDKNGSAAQLWELRSQESAPVADSFFRIKSFTSSLVLDGSSSSTLKASQASNSQYWQTIRQADGTYLLRNPTTNKYLDVLGGSSSAGTPTQIWENNGSCAQYWNIIKNSDGSNTITSSCSGMALDVQGGQVSTVGASVQIWSSNLTNAQKWSFEALPSSFIPESTYSINLPSKLKLDVAGASTANGSRIHLWSANGTIAQRWEFKESTVTPGAYTLRNPASGRTLDVQGGGTSAGTPTQIWDINNTCAQNWNVQRNGDGSYTLLSSCSGMALDVDGGRISAIGTRVQIWSPNQSDAQKWTFGAP